ncbi:MAG TPA: ATP-binding protein, partial [Minicystis sp.]|nr:ATP-binding protein [Minicystis sp.]
PLRAGPTTLGALTLVFAESRRSYAAEDVAFAEDLARRAAIAIQNARLYAAEQRAREAADAANRAKDEFLAAVSHELRTPLNAIQGWAKMLVSSRLDESKRSRALETIERNAVAMTQLIDDLLDVSRIISGKMRLDVAFVELGSVVRAAADAVRPAAAAKDIALELELDTPIDTRGDPSRLQQVVWNLLSNAVKFTEPGGRVDVTVRRVGGAAEIAVVDTGRGIDERFMPHVFQPFRQADAGISRSSGGLGLGLAISRQLVELHGGQIRASSAGLGKGAWFVVRLPITTHDEVGPTKEPPHRAPARAYPPRTQLEGLSVLVVEDDADARQLIEAVLVDCGANVLLASNVPEAMAALESGRPDVLLSDIGMPGENGYDLMRRVRELPPERGGGIPAAAITAYARAEDRRRALAAGYLMHVPKPVDPGELCAVASALATFRDRRG